MTDRGAGWFFIVLGSAFALLTGSLRYGFALTYIGGVISGFGILLIRPFPKSK